MAQILYPPYIEGKLPAQCGTMIKIPFQFNRATGASDIGTNKLHAKIKGINSNNIIVTLESYNYANNIAIFNLPNSETLQIGQYYKIQLAWGDSIYYSTVGIFKYTVQPKMTFTDANGEQSSINLRTLTTTATYTTMDETEKVYSYNYQIIDCNNKVIYTSPHIINTQEFTRGNNNEYQLFLILDFTMLDRDQDCWVQITINTVNHLYDNQYISDWPYTVPAVNSSNTKIFSHNRYNIISYEEAEDIFLLRRRISNTNNQWSVLTNTFEKQFNDMAIECGISYDYEFVVQTRGAGARPIVNICHGTSQPLYFDDMYLSDKDNDYCIQFNPKISSFKTNIIEQKQNTIGGKYPIFIRNGQTEYTEFGISGLISYLMNRPEETVAERTGTNSTNSDAPQLVTNLTGENIYKERIFRTELIKWLNNGEPKLFRSPTEGNFIVRITNVFLTPNDTLGRMLYTFNCTAVEVAECNYENLRKYNLVE